MSVAWSHPMLMVIHFCSNQRGDFSWLSPLYIWIEYIVWWVIYGQILILDGLTPPARSPLLQQGIAKKNVWKKNAMCPPKCETQPSHRPGRNVTSGADLDMRNTWNTTYNNIQHIHMLRTYIYHLSCALMFEQRLNTWNSWSPTGPKEILQLRGCCSWRHL